MAPVPGDQLDFTRRKLFSQDITAEAEKAGADDREATVVRGDGRTSTASIVNDTGQSLDGGASTTSGAADQDVQAQNTNTVHFPRETTRPSDTGSALAPGSLRNAATRPGPSTILRPAGAATATDVPSTSRTRDRGYSLRRSLFAQNMHKQLKQEDTIIEMEPPSSSHAKDHNSMLLRKTGKKEPTMTIAESWEEADLVQGSVRLSDPLYELPTYRRWLSKQASRRSFRQYLKQKYRELRRRITHANEIPPSADGRHVRVNVLRATNIVEERTGKPYIPNIIRSCRYTVLNFVPRQLYAQFAKLANFYFLCVSILQMIPGLSTTGTYTTIVPLLVFVGISMAKEGYDDLRRHRLDKEENERLGLVLDGQVVHGAIQRTKKGGDVVPTRAFSALDWRTVKWQDIRVGDVVLLHRDTPVPADLVLLHSNEATGAAYIETKSLDGETNLKLKKPPRELFESCGDNAAIASLDTEFVVEDPNLDLYKFEGRLSMTGRTIPLTNNEVIYRGSILRNTESAIGLVIYSGEECKIRMNATKNPRVKAPMLQFKVNRVVVLVAALVLFIASLMTVAYQIWHKTTERKAWYLQEARVPSGQILTSFIIMFNTMLPLSLYVSLEIVKVAQMFLMKDVDMYDPDSDIPMEPRTSTINEELGQVSYIFSDKTGTLTTNSMRFRKISVAGTAWLHDPDLQEEALQTGGPQKLKHKKRGGKGKGMDSRRHRKSARNPSVGQDTNDLTRSSMTSTAWHPSNRHTASLQTGKTEELLEYIYHRPHSIFARKVRFFILGLALCHTCIPEKDHEGNISFQAASPDEMALVTAAQELGYIVTDRQSGTITVKTYPNGEDEESLYETFKILDIIEFSSTRKRMSIIMRLPDRRICIFCKGADTTLRKLLRLSDLAAANVVTIDRRTNQRKSMEAQEVLRRESVQSSRKGSVSRSSMVTAAATMLGGNSGVSLGQGSTVRDSIDHWLREREADVDFTMPRASSQYYTPRASTQLGPSKKSPHMGVRASLGGPDSLRSSFQSDYGGEFVDEALVVDDNAVFERCFQHIDDFATEGLRTLLYGYRYLDDDEYQKWKEIYADATTSLVDRQEKVEQAGELIENQLELMGATAIEDKLQKGVPDAIDRFRRAGIKLWMLTGDKRETAINIGQSCRLIKDYSTIIILDHADGNLENRMASAVADINNKQTAHSVLVVDGQTLMLVDAESASKALFTDLAIAADSVICCRASPSQKASLVKTIRTKVKGSVTLAIGDGANDIAMIQEAHVGIGIAGKEGLQAARTSDYSIAQFRFLVKLLLVHGRWNYIRVCKYTLGTFWKEMVFYLVQALYQRWNGYTGTSLYEPWSLSMFNTLFTSLPVIFMGVFEKDLAASTLLAVPELYSIGQRNGGFNFPLYCWWAFIGACDALIVYFTMYSIYGQAMFTRDNQLYAMGALAFSACVIVISLKLQAIELHNKSATAVIAMFLSIGGWWLWNLLLSLTYPHDPIYNVNRGLLDTFGKNLLWWTTLFLIVMAVSLFEITVKVAVAAIRPSDVDTFRTYEQDLEIRKRFEESAADLLQQGWNRGTKKSSMDLAREAEIQAEREAHVEELLNRPRTMEGRKSSDSASRMRRRHSRPTDDPEVAVKLSKAGPDETSHKSTDIGELFSKGFGTVRKGPDLN